MRLQLKQRILVHQLLGLSCKRLMLVLVTNWLVVSAFEESWIFCRSGTSAVCETAKDVVWNLAGFRCCSASVPRILHHVVAVVGGLIAIVKRHHRLLLISVNCSVSDGAINIYQFKATATFCQPFSEKNISTNNIIKARIIIKIVIALRILMYCLFPTQREIKTINFSSLESLPIGDTGTDCFDIRSRPIISVG